MNIANDHKSTQVHKTVFVLLILALIVGAGLLGWWLGQPNTTSNSQSSNNQASNVNNSNTASVKSLVSYVLPDGWKEASCPSVAGAVYILPNGSSGLNCNDNPSSPVKISVDPGNDTDCNQLQNVQNVKKHICISLYINGHKSLKSSTEYLPSSSYNQTTTVNAYYVNTGKGVIELQYVFNGDNQYQVGFDQLANSINVKT